MGCGAGMQLYRGHAVRRSGRFSFHGGEVIGCNLRGKLEGKIRYQVATGANLLYTLHCRGLVSGPGLHDRSKVLFC